MRRSSKARKKRRRRLKRFSILRYLALLCVYGFFAGVGFAYYGYTEFAYDLPDDLTALKEPPTKATRVYSADGELIGEFFLEKRVVVPLERIPDHVRQAFISAEDRRFWDHPGFDFIGIARAAYNNFVTKAGSKQGASTITQQTTRMLMLTNERSYARKIKELILSVRVEKELTKKDILEIYLNRVYLGNGAYGVQAAAQAYFGKDVLNLSIGEAAMLAGLVQRPTDYSPLHNLEAARTRQSYVLGQMQGDNYISETEAQDAKAEPLALVEDDIPLNHIAAPYFVEHVRRWAQARFGHHTVFFGGLNIYTTLDMRMQRSAEAAVRDGLEDLDRRIGFRGALGKLDELGIEEFQSKPPQPYLPGIESASLAIGADMLPDVPYIAAVIEMPRRSQYKLTVAVGARTFNVERRDARRLRVWRGERPEPIVDPKTKRKKKQPKPRLEIGDLLPVRLSEDDKGNDVVVLSQVPEVQGALVAMDPHSGKVEALVGGYDYRKSEFNRATQAHRQIGSAIKPFIYATALSRGTTHLSTVSDSPVAVRTAGGIWAPKNYDGKYLGNITLRTALAKSLNTVSVRLVLKYGVDPIIALVRKVGIQSPFARHVSIALGTPDLTLLEVVSGYSVFPNGGKKIRTQDDRPGSPPGRFVELVTDDDGRVVADFRDRDPVEQAISPQLAYLMVDLMKVVVARGTARKAQLLGRPAAGKTGTSTEWRDAWFLGYTADRICGVWVGRDDFTPIGARATGGGAALPIWLQFMRASHPSTPVRDFAPPEDISLVRADEMSGQPMPPGSRSARWIPFMRGTVPPRFAQSVESSSFEATDGFAAKPTPERLRKTAPQ